jgi:DNA-binding response OmpR family regulator
MQGTLRTPDVLIVDDDPQMRGYLEMALHAVQCTVHCVDGSALEPIQPRVALVDLLLEHGEGLAWITQLAQSGAHVILMTGLAADAPLVERGRQAGARSVLHKPFSLHTLRDVIRKALSPR